MKRSAGPFEILEVLGEGSFGTVCVARVNGDPLRRKVALKILKVAYTKNQKILNRTRDEARMLSRINHPNIVRVERLIELGGRPVVVMEHVQGSSLDQLLLRFKEGLPASVALEVVRQTCMALHIAFNEALGDDGRPMRVIHRDIKPSNVMMSIHGEVKVLDFGIARGEFEGREADTQSVVMGSRPYMAPERLDGISDSPAVDVYSAGMSLFELLAGRTMSLSINPVTHDQAMNRQLAYLKLPGLGERAVEDVRAVLRRMCAYDRDHRPSAIDVARDIEQCLYALDPDQRITLEEFARTTVLPIYEARPRITPEEAATSAGDEELLREVTGQIDVPTKGHRRELIAYTPYLFVGVLAAVVLLLSSAVLYRRATSGGGGVPGGVNVRVFLPRDAQGRAGEAFLATSGTIQVVAGRSVLEVLFDDGRNYECGFDAHEGTNVQFVEAEQGIRVDRGFVVPCSLASSKVPR